MANNQTFTVAELAEQFNVQVPTIRRYISHFDIPHTKDGRKTLLDPKSVEFIGQIIQLKNNGLNLKQIKDMVSKEQPATTPEPSQPAKQEQPQKPPTPPAPTKQESPKPQQPAERPRPEKKSPQQQKPKPASEPQREPETRKTKEDDINLNNTNLIDLKNKTLMTRDNISKEIQNQSRRTSKLEKLLDSRRLMPRERAELNISLNKRYDFLAGLRNLRDNWLEKGKETSGALEDVIVEELLKEA